MNPKNLPAILIAICGLLACIGMFISTTSIANVAGEFAPIPQATAVIALDRRSQEAQVTATYIAKLGDEVGKDTENTHAIMRAKEQSRFERSEMFEQAAMWAGVFVVSAGSIGAGVWLGGRGVGAGIKHARVAMLPLPLPSGPILIGDRIVDTNTGAVWSVTEDRQAQLDHAKAVREFRAIVVRAIAGAVVEAAKPKLLT